MQALTLHAQTLGFDPEHALPAAETGDALIKVALAGVCDTDLQLKAGYMDFSGIPGHEFVGLVVEGPADFESKRVVGEINVACEACDFCKRNLQRHCPNRSVLGILNRDGAHAEYLRLPARNLVTVPNNIPDHEAVFTEPLAAACEILEQVNFDPNMNVAVVGDGKLGLLVSQVLALTGCQLHVVGRHDNKLNILKNRGIRTEKVATGEQSKLPAGWADVVVECTGHISGYQTSRQLLRSRGILVLKTTIKNAAEIDLTDLVVNEITLIGSRCGRFAPAIRLLERGLIDLESMITEEYPFHQGLQAYKHAETRGTLKVLLRP